MFLTRLGPYAKCIITGDLSQIDLPRRQQSGLIKSLHILKNISGIGMLQLTSEDVVRHRLVKQIIDAYEKDSEADKYYNNNKKEQKPTSNKDSKDEVE
jgi:phosphate starvation-inducible PhoH-like protein